MKVIHIVLVATIYIGLLTLLSINHIDLTNYVSKAVGGSANVYLLASSPTINSEQQLTININSYNYPTTFAKVVITYNPSQIKMSRELVMSNVLGRIVSIDNAITANATGRLTIIAAVDPSKGIIYSPSGIFQLATLYFSPATTSSNVISTINFDSLNSQLISTDASLLTTSYGPLTITVNAVSAPTNTPSPTPTPTLVKPTSTSTSTPTPAPTSGPILTPTKTATMTPTRAITPTSTPTTVAATVCGVGECKGYYSSTSKACSSDTCRRNKTCSASTVICGGITCYKRSCN